MARVRYNFQAGTITNNPLASGGTSVTSAEFAALPAVAGPDTLILILDPAGVDGAPEVVTVTAHTGSSTTATVTRASESSTARAHASGTTWIHGVTAADIVNLATASPAASAVGDAAVAGSAATASPSDHKHAREAFATNAVVLGSAAAAGSATTPMRSDSTIAAFDATSPSTQAVGDAAVVGTAAFAARRDHKHAREAFGTAPPAVATGASAAGSATTPARSDHAHSSDPPSCRVFHNTTQSYASGALTAAAFNSELFDTAAMHDTATNNSRITFNTAGIYVVSWSGSFTAAADYTNVLAALFLNGTTYLALHNSGAITSATFGAEFTVTTIYKFAASDYVEAQAGQVNGASAARNLSANGFSATWLGRG